MEELLKIGFQIMKEKIQITAYQDEEEA